MTKVKIFQNPTYTEAEWVQLNPFLTRGMIGFVIDPNTGEVINSKVGPGLWNELEYQNAATFYPYSDPVTNEIGDVLLGQDRSGDLVVDIIRDIISPFVEPTVSAATNDAGGPFASTSTLIVGTSITSEVRVNFNVSDPSKLVAGNNIFIEAGGLFTNEGFFEFTGGPLTLTLAAPLSPSSLVTYNININAIYTDSDGNNANSNVATTKIRFWPEMVWGSSSDPNLSIAGLEQLPNRRTVGDYPGDYSFTSAYSYIGIPVQLGPNNVQFSDVTNPNSIQGYAMSEIGTFTLNNGIGTYDYIFYRSDFLLIDPTILRLE